MDADTDADVEEEIAIRICPLCLYPSAVFTLDECVGCTKGFEAILRNGEGGREGGRAGQTRINQPLPPSSLPPPLAPSKWPLCLPQCPKGKSLWPDRGKTMEEDLLTDATRARRPFVPFLPLIFN